MITKRLEYGVLLLAAFIFHIFIVDYISFWLFAFLLMLPLVSLLIAALAMSGVVAELIINNAPIQKNESLPIQLKVYNKFFFLACRVRVRLIIRNELMNQEQTQTFFMTATHYGQTVEQIVSSQYCGILSCSISELRIYDALGLFSFRKKSELSYIAIVLPTVYPLLAINSTILQDVQNNVTSRIIKGNDPSELMDIREYRDGDRHARIHWKLSSKYNQLMVKDFGDPISNDVLIMFDLNGTSNEQLSALLDAVYSISNFLLENQITYDMEWYDSLNEHLVNTNVTQKSDMGLAIETILSNSKFQKQPWVLKSCSDRYGYNPYSVVLYLCSEISSNSIAMLQKQLAGSKIRIILVADYSPITNTNITLIDLENIKESLSKFVI